MKMTTDEWEARESFSIHEIAKIMGAIYAEETKYSTKAKSKKELTDISLLFLLDSIETGEFKHDGLIIKQDDEYYYEISLTREAIFEWFRGYDQNCPEVFWQETDIFKLSEDRPSKLRQLGYSGSPEKHTPIAKNNSKKPRLTQLISDKSPESEKETSTHQKNITPEDIKKLADKLKGDIANYKLPETEISQKHVRYKCTECNHQWEALKNKTICPKCGNHLYTFELKTTENTRFHK